MLFMTFNGYVIIALIIGMGIGHGLFAIEDKDSGMPINCCSCAWVRGREKGGNDDL